MKRCAHNLRNLIIPICCLAALATEPVAAAERNAKQYKYDCGLTQSEPAKRCVRSAIDHILPAGEFSVDLDEHGTIVRVNMNRIKDWSRVPGIKKHWPLRGPEGQIKCYHGVSTNIKDVDGDGRLDVFRVAATKPFGQLIRLDENNRLIWKSEKRTAAAR